MLLFKHLYYKKFCNKIINKHIDYKREKYDDRNVLESIIFPYVLAKYDPENILDIGREDYQSFYNEFFANRNLKTIDMNPDHAEFGAEGTNHVIDNATSLKEHYLDESFDFILMNGVYGWGLDKEEDIQKCFSAIYDILNTNGVLIVGYNDEIFPFDEIDGISKLKKLKFKPLNSDTFTCINGNHTYKFFIKK